MDKQVVFKTSAFGGFEKKAVLDYIYRLNEEASTMQTQLREQVDSLTAARDSISENLRQTNERLLLAQRELEATRTELSKERARAVELSSMSEGLQGELSRHREQQTRLRGDLERTMLERDEIAKHNEEMREKQQQVDHAVANIGKLLLDARSDADAVAAKTQREVELLLSDAKAEAARLVKDAEAAAQSRLSEARADAERLLADARGKADLIAEEAKQKTDLLQIEANLAKEEAVGQFRSYAHHITQIQSAIADLMTAYDEKTEEISRLVETSSRAFERTVEVIEASDLALHHEQVADVPVTPEYPDDGEPANDFFRFAADGRS